MIRRISNIILMAVFFPLLSFSQELKLVKPIFEPDKRVYEYYYTHNYGVSSDYKYAFIGSAFKNNGLYSTVYIYNLEENKFDYLLYDLNYKDLEFSIDAIFFSLNNKYLCIFAWDSNCNDYLLKWDLEGKYFLDPLLLEDFKQGVKQIKFLDQDKYITISRISNMDRDSKTIYCHSFSTGKLLWKKEYTNDIIYSIDNTTNGFISLHSGYKEQEYIDKVCFWNSDGHLLKEKILPHDVVPMTSSEIIYLDKGILISNILKSEFSTDIGVGLFDASSMKLLARTLDMNYETSVSISVDKKKLMYLTDNNKIRIISLTDGTLQSTEVFSLDLSMTEDYNPLKYFFTGANKMTYLTPIIAKEYDLENKTTRCLSLPYGEIEVLKYFNHNAQKILLGITNNDDYRDYNQIIVYDTDKDSICNYLNWNKLEYNNIYDKISISNDDKYIVVIEDTNKVNLYNSDDLTLYKSFSTKNNSSITYTKMNQDCTKLVIAASDSTIRIITIKNDVEHLLHVNKIFNYVEMISDTELLLVMKYKSEWYYDIYELGDDVEYKLRSCGKSKSINMLPFTYSLTDQYLYYADDDYIYKVSINDKQNNQLITPSPNYYNSVLSSKDNNYLLLNSSNRQIKILEKLSDNIIMDLQNYIPYQDDFNGSICVADMSTDNKYLAVKEITPALLIYDIAKYTSVSEYNYFEDTSKDIRVYPVPVANGKLTLDLSDKIKTVDRITMCNYLGIVVNSWENLKVTSTKIDLQIDETITSGIYYLNLYIGNRNISKKIIVG